MILTVTQENLSKSLSQVSRITTGKNALPILNNVLIEAEKGSLKLTTTNLEIAIITQIRAKIEKEGKTTLPCQILTNFIDLTAKEPIEIELKEEGVHFKSKNSLTTIKGTPADEFPLIPQIEKKDYFKIKAEALKTALDKVIFAVSPTETRVEISGMLFVLNSPEVGYLTLVGTDSYRLAEKTAKFEEANFKDKKELIIPAKTLQELSRLLEKEGVIEVYFSENQVLFAYDSTELISRIINGEYPDYKQIIPQASVTRAVLEKDSLLKAIKAVSLFTKTGINDINLKFLSKNNKVVISSLNSQVGQSEINLEAEIKGDDNEIVFNYRYLLDGLLNINGSEIKIGMVDDHIPIVITSPEEEGYLYLVMPIKK